MIILLHGVPGVGKTSTAGEIEIACPQKRYPVRPNNFAECATEANQKPLLPITCGEQSDYNRVRSHVLTIQGDLGSTSTEVESKLQEAFQLAQLWECVLLLNEADIFLAQRNEDDIQ